MKFARTVCQPLLLAGLITFFQAPCSGQATVVFHSASDQLTPAAKQTLDSLAKEIVKTNTFEEVALVGHTDTDGDAGYNQALSLRRARSVKAYLTQMQLPVRFHLLHKGETQALNADKTENEKKLNRRVEILRNHHTGNAVYAAFAPPVQQYRLDPKKERILTFKGGTKVYFEPGLFANVNPQDQIYVRVQEYYAKPEFVLANLTTRTASNELIESRGMVHFEAFQAGKKLSLAEGKKLLVLFADRKLNDNTTLFCGEASGGEMVWTEAPAQAGNMESMRTGKRTIDSGRITTYQYKTQPARKRQKKNKPVPPHYTDDDIIKVVVWDYEAIGGKLYKITETTQKGATSADTTEAESEIATKALLLSTTKLGWINCDRFYDSASPKVDLVVEFREAPDPNIVLVFKDINSVLPYSYREHNRVVFSQVPANMAVEIVGLYKGSGSNTLMYASKATTTGTQRTEVLELKEVSEQELRNSVSQL